MRFAERWKKWIPRIVAGLIVLLCANTLKRMGESPQFSWGFVWGMVVSLALNTPLLLLFLPMPRWARCVLAIAILPCALGVALLLGDYHFAFAILSLLFHFWIVSKSLKKGAVG